MARLESTEIAAIDDTSAALSEIAERVNVLILRNAARITPADATDYEGIIAALVRVRRYQQGIRKTIADRYQKGTR